MKQIKIFILLNCLAIFVINAQTTLPTLWDFSNPGISNPPNGWTAGLGTNGNLTYSGSQNAAGVDGISARLDATGEFIGVWFAEKPGPVSYWLRGTGISPNPAFTGIFSVQQSVDGSNWTTLREFNNSMPGTMTRYVDAPAETTRYIRFFYTSKQSGSNVALDSVLIRKAPAPPTPVMQVKQNGNAYVINSTFIQGNNSLTQFEIKNEGTQQSLIISAVNFNGAAAADYSISSLLPDTILPGQTKNLSLSFSTSISGSRKAKMIINSNDTENPVFPLNLYGIGGNYASEPESQPSNFNATNISAFRYSYSFNAANIQPEKYIVLRKNSSEVTETPADGVTYKRGNYIGNAQVAYIGDSAGTFQSVFTLANTNYHFAVFACNGPQGYENYLTTSPLKGNINTTGKNTGSYYTGINPNNPNFVQQLTAKINPHDTVFYSLYIARVVNPWLGRDTANAKKVVNCVYTGAPYIYEDPFLWWTGTNNALLTREHTFAQSWMPSNQGNPDWPNAPGTTKELPEYSDLHNLFPAAQTIGNAVRSNNPFGIVVNATNTSPTGFGKLGTDSASKVVYEPRNEHKGDLARALFYMCVAYHNINGKNWSIPLNQNLDILRRWNTQDPPDALEIARHELIFAAQKNRNPFIDNPDWADRINFYTMGYIADPNPPLPSVNIIKPASGEALSVNKNYGIKWVSVNVDSVGIYISYNNQPFTEIAAAVPAQLDSFIWNTGTVTSNNVKILLKDLKSVAADTSAVFSVSGSVGFEDYDNKFMVSAFPNPFGNSLNLQWVALNNTNVFIYVYDARGKLVHKKCVNSNVGLNNVTIEELSYLDDGIYFIHFNGQFKSDIRVLKMN